MMAPDGPATPRAGWAAASWSIRATARSSSGPARATSTRRRPFTMCTAQPTARGYSAASRSATPRFAPVTCLTRRRRCSRPRPALARVRTLLPAAARRWVPDGGHGWGRQAHAARLFDGFTVLLNLEQLPHPENRITLGHRRDALGVPLPTLEWRWRPDDQRGLDRLRAVVAAELRA